MPFEARHLTWSPTRARAVIATMGMGPLVSFSLSRMAAVAYATNMKIEMPAKAKANNWNRKILGILFMEEGLPILDRIGMLGAG